MSEAAATWAVPDIAAVAALFADPSRARMVTALLDGRALPASVLAAESGVSASTASEHLGRLVHGRILTVERSGRHRYYRLAGSSVAHLVETLGELAPQPSVRSLREATRASALRRSRTCYDHLAGRLGVAVTEALMAQGALERTDGVIGTERGQDDLAKPVRSHAYRLGPHAEQLCRQLGVDLAHARAQRRPLLRFCVDWSEQRHHLAGSLGAAVYAQLESAGWLRRRDGHRAVDLTDAGRSGLQNVLDLPAEAF